MRFLTFLLVLICAAPLLAEGDEDVTPAEGSAEADSDSAADDAGPAPLFGRPVQGDAPSESDDSEEDEGDEPAPPAIDSTPPATDPAEGEEELPEPDEDASDDAPAPEDSEVGETDAQPAEGADTSDALTDEAEGIEDTADDDELAEEAETQEDEEDAPAGEEPVDESDTSDDEGEVDEILTGIQEGLDSAGEAVRQAAEEAAAPIEIPPANLSEPPSIPRRPPPPPIPGLDEDQGWRPEVSASSGLFAHEGTGVGFLLGAEFALVEYGPSTRPDYMLASDYARRDVWGVLDLELGFEPNEGLDETEVLFAVKAVRTEVTTYDESESGVSEIRFGPIRYQRALSMDRELDLTVSAVEGYADRRFALREGTAVRVLADVEALGFEHIRYTPLASVDHFFNGVRALSVDITVAPEFALGNRGSQFRYIAGAGADVAMGSRDGGLLVVHSDMNARSGVGGDITEWVSWEGLIGYRGAIDSRRPNRAGWYSTIRLEGRFL